MLVCVCLDLQGLARLEVHTFSLIGASSKCQHDEDVGSLPTNLCGKKFISDFVQTSADRFCRCEKING